MSLSESMTPYFDSNIQPTEELLQLKVLPPLYIDYGQPVTIGKGCYKHVNN